MLRPLSVLCPLPNIPRSTKKCKVYSWNSLLSSQPQWVVNKNATKKQISFKVLFSIQKTKYCYTLGSFKFSLGADILWYQEHCLKKGNKKKLNQEKPFIYHIYPCVCKLQSSSNLSFFRLRNNHQDIFFKSSHSLGRVQNYSDKRVLQPVVTLTTFPPGFFSSNSCPILKLTVLEIALVLKLIVQSSPVRAISD